MDNICSQQEVSMSLRAFNNISPQLGEKTYIDESAVIIGLLRLCQFLRVLHQEHISQHARHAR
jgi:carbonic anhydrase/acetyltransferase-like protein (isoleucine patch superfamily)